MPGKRAFEEKIAALDALRQAPKETCLDPLRKALANRNNFIAAKAADLTREFHLEALTPELLTAFARFFENAEKTDPQCWAKNAISRALAALEYQEPEPFLRGLRHIQLEPVWGGRSDTAGTLRSTCALALVQCRSLSETALLSHLVDALADQDKSVRTEVARAIEQVGSPAAALLLRLKANLGHDEPEVQGACYSGVLRIEGVSALSWTKRFLTAGDDAAAEAALAIAGTHAIEGFQVLRDSLETARDPWFVSVLLSAIALTRQEAAVEFLLDLIRTESPKGEAAIEALLRSIPAPEVTTRLEKLVTSNPRFARAFAMHAKK